MGQALPVAGDMAAEKSWKVRLAFVAMFLGGLGAFIYSTKANHGTVTPTGPLFFLAGILGCLSLWVVRRGRAETIRHLTFTALAVTLAVSLATLGEQAKPPAKRSQAANMAGQVTVGFQAIADRFRSEPATPEEHLARLLDSAPPYGVSTGELVERVGKSSRWVKQQLRNLDAVQVSRGRWMAP